MAQVLDYSAGFPGATAIARDGYKGAVRYIGFPSRKKCTTAGELQDFSRNGLGMALVFEDTLTTWRSGRTGGGRSAATAHTHAAAIGFPTSRPIYFAIDQDVVAQGEFDAMLEYLRGCGDTLGGPARVGVYGEADVIDRARDAGVARYFWQTAAWSRSRRATAHLYQHVGSVYVGGIACDTNDVLAADWGQHNLTLLEDDVALTDSITVSSPGDRKYIETHPAKDIIGDTYFWAADTFKAMFGQVLPMLTALTAAVTDGDLDQDAVLTRLDTAVREATSQTITSTVLPAVRDAVVEAVGTDQADTIVDAIAARLQGPPKS
jgi:hypothetical protein